jgi:hypothetical protein
MQVSKNGILINTLILKPNGIHENLEQNLKNDYMLIVVHAAISPSQQKDINTATIGVANGESRLNADFL